MAQFTVEALRTQPSDIRVDGFTAADELLAGVPCEVIRVDDRADVVVLYLHGGGYLRGRAEEFRGASVPIARALHAEVHVAEYPLAPESPFPAAVDACSGVLAELRQSSAEAGKALVVIGDSAGASLAVAAMLSARDAGRALPDAAILHCPYADMTASSPSLTSPEYANERLSSERIDWLRETYLAAGSPDPRDPRHSPVYADLTGLPHLLVQVGGRDPFHDDGARLAARAREGGVTVTLTDYPDSPHVWVVKGTNPVDPEAARAVDEMAAFVAANLHS